MAEKERLLAEQAHRETQKLRDEAERLQREIAEQRDGMLKKAKEDARKVLVKAQRESEQIISELKRARSKDGASLKEHELHALRGRLQGSMDEMSDGLRTQVARATEPPKDLKPGETVELTMLGTKGTVLTLPDAKGEAMVQAGVMKMKVHISQMQRVQEETKSKKKPGGKIALAEKAVSMECDVRGMNLEEAILAVDLYLDNCVMHSLKQVQIIHGKGTGVLRSGIQAHLKKHRSVQEFRLGRYGEGEDGVTVVTLK